jgi:hypothetical protein
MSLQYGLQIPPGVLHQTCSSRGNIFLGPVTSFTRPLINYIFKDLQEILGTESHNTILQGVLADLTTSAVS